MRYLALLLLGCLVPTAFGSDLISESDQKTRTGGLSPDESFARMQVADDLRLDQLLSEPTVKQPVFLNFDERGRLWVVQYIQYPHPAGLRIVSHDQYWRNVYDKVPQAPPHHVRGKDKITIHEDTDGDGRFDKHKTFLDGMNMVTSVAHGRGGHWVLNPPYLLFYPDRNRDDVPDGDPEVHLAGFGLEDSHSIANSLRWGPDGWLYGAQGSTVTANIVRPGFPDKPRYSQGQNIWRYHPELRKYEVFAEGGGNAFGVEIDSVGRVFSGHNGGNTRGFHYPQGGYLRKGFTKHGPLSNPYAFGYFPGMKHHDVERFTHNFVIYGGASFPPQYHGKLFGAEPLQGRVVLADFEPRGSSFETTDVTRPVTSQDDWFRPVDIKVGPDGGIYLCDWYDGQVGHYRSHEGNIDPTNGRIYRLQAREANPVSPFDLGTATSDELIDYLSHPNRWFRQTALRVIGDRKDFAALPRLKGLLTQETGQLALEAFWALNLTSELDAETYLIALRHPNPHVRFWATRLIGDRRKPGFGPELSRVAAEGDNVEVRQQLAATARRLSSAEALPILSALMKRDEDAADVYQPLMVWWSLESHCRVAPQEAVQLFNSESDLWSAKLVDSTILQRLMQRFAMEGKRSDLLQCATLLRNAPNPDAIRRLLSGFEAAFQGRAIPSLPAELTKQLAEAGSGSLALRVRQGDDQAIEQALDSIRDGDTDKLKRIELLNLCAQLQTPGLPSIVGRVLRDQDADSAVRETALGALRYYESDGIAEFVLETYPQLSAAEQAAAQNLLSSRANWARQLMRAVDDGQLDPLSISIEVLRNCLLLEDSKLAQSIKNRWGDIAGATTEEMKAEVERLSRLLNSQRGDVYQGQKLYAQSCGKCHKLFIDGGDIGPDLTSYKRDDIPNMVLNVINPNAEIREGYENYVVITDDGQVLTGLVIERDPKMVVLRTADGHTQTIDRDSIEESRVLGHSLMPEGLLQQFTDKQITDLFAYLRSTQPLNN